MARSEKMIACRFCNYEGRISSKNTTVLYFRTRDMTIREGKNLLLKGANGRGYHVLVVNADVEYEPSQWMKKLLESVRIVRDGKTISELAEEEKAAAEVKPKKPIAKRSERMPEGVQLKLY